MPTDLQRTTTLASSTVGISDDQINIAFIGVDFSALAATGLVPDLGDQQKQVQSIVDEINANGGINGRKINLHFKLLDVLSGGADAIQAACIEATQEFKAAVVILPPAAARDLARCTAVTNKTLTIYATGMDSGLYTESQGRLFTPGGMSIDRQMRGWANEMDQGGSPRRQDDRCRQRRPASGVPERRERRTAARAREARSQAGASGDVAVRRFGNHVVRAVRRGGPEAEGRRTSTPCS